MPPGHNTEQAERSAPDLTPSPLPGKAGRPQAPSNSALVGLPGNKGLFFTGSFYCLEHL